MPPKNPNPDPKQTSIQQYFGQKKQIPQDDPFLSPDPNAGRGDGFPVTQPSQPSLVSESIGRGDPVVDVSVSPLAPLASAAAVAANQPAAAAVAANQPAAAAVAANQDAAAREARAIARGQLQQANNRDVLTQYEPIYSPRRNGGSARTNKMNFLTRGKLRKSTKSKMKKKAKVTRKTYKRQSRGKRSGKK
jgi:hypothetical protein